MPIRSPSSRSSKTRPVAVRTALMTLVCLAPFYGSDAVAGSSLDAATAAAGLKEALQVGTGRSVDLLGRVDGYLGNEAVRIPMPERIEFVEKGLRAVGRGDIVDEFLTGMNRAAEAAAPLAKDVFVDAIGQMTFDDALRIVRGQGHEATDYLQETAGPKLGDLFRPIVAERLEGAGATKAFDRMMESAASLPFGDRVAFDLDAYVTGKALDGMFLMIGKEEKKMRKDPAARSSELIRKVFGAGADGADEVPWWKKIFSGGQGVVR